MVNARDFNWTIVAIWAALSGIGLVAIYSATLGPVSEFLPAYIQENFFKQVIWVGIALLIMVSVQFVSPRNFQVISYLFYGICILLMTLTVFIGVEVSGSQSWLRIGPVNMQPGEIAKLATILAAAHYLTSRRNLSAENITTALVVVMLFAIPVILLILQSETGSALVYLGLLPIVLFWSGLPYGISLFMIAPAIIAYFTIIDWYWGIVAAILITAAIFFIQRRTWLSFTSFVVGLLVVIGTEVSLNQVLQPHQRARIESFVNPTVDPQGSGWNIIQAKTAIGSGGLYGKGFMEGTQTQLRFLPEQWTDFIFCVIGEEFGFLGAGTVLLLFLILILKLISMASAHKHPFAQMVMVSTAGLFFIHLLINIGSTTALIPIIGITLPFISYGGTALITNTLLLAICLNMDFYKRSFSIYR
ncbi:MAG: FtsW/RodA/SpoVE family cell cycle protein [Balneolaceae bacterium]